MIKKIATLGRASTKECVTEYIIQFSDDGEQWRSYVNPDGEVQVNECELWCDIFFVVVFVFVDGFFCSSIIGTDGAVDIFLFFQFNW